MIYEVTATFEVDAENEQAAEDKFYDVLASNPLTHEMEGFVLKVHTWKELEESFGQ